MHPLRSLAALALAAALCSCQNDPTASDDPHAKGGLALAFSARALAQMGPAADSLHLRLVGERDTIQSVSRLGDTVRFDGLRTGIWFVDAQVYANDSGIRAVAWVGSATARVEPGRVARVPLVLRKPTGSLIVEIDIDDGELDTPIVIAPHDTTHMVPPIGIDTIDTPWVQPPHATPLPIDLADSLDWGLDTGRHLTTPRYDTSASWIRNSVRLLDTYAGRFGLMARVAIRGGSVGVASIVAPVQDACGIGPVDTLCQPHHIQLLGRRMPAAASSPSDSSIRVAEVLVDFRPGSVRQIVLSDDYGTYRIAPPTLEGSRCEHPDDAPLPVCYDGAGVASSWRDPFKP